MRVGIQEDDQLDDATRAFDDLRAEVAVLRRAVEALGPALKENRSPDYSLSLGQIAKTQAAIGTRLEAIEGHPALRMTPAAFGEQLERAVTKASREASALTHSVSSAWRLILPRMTLGASTVTGVVNSRWMARDPSRRPWAV
jgi:Family of unknown function (DUF6118)